ncbi:Septum formation protein Maf [Emticicia oligotrophica DSM 17448]|uniref:dTTP/UTP pyrophosphatase n=1 Tax=Emticicia oligotrophica (strain DSM 17448 / CIP 109782 / MTCC 6937 / GPTSA100-15) TaxID=929562 RepID=A0ABM5N5S0_EMTOG|nr:MULTISPECIES: Maf family nucleotide pyrophosphatase [Emticicia]AFK04800.1 Septum formation protein Maf [Emticicia oligotrophica DSM 17448]
MKLIKPLVLASNSPRRKEIMHNAGFDFTVKVIPTDESFSERMPVEEVPVFLAKTKAECFKENLQDEIILCADTVVIIDRENESSIILNKPADYEEAKGMLKMLSGRVHRVITGVCVMTKEETIGFSDTSFVHFKELSDWEIDYYIERCKPFDKAGAYGVQDFIGMIGIPKIEGSFYTVMGLPVHRVYEVLEKYVVKK